MVDGKDPRPMLEVVKGGLSCEIFFPPLWIIAAPKDNPPFPVDAFAFEEDTFLVLSADTTVRDPKIPLVRIMTRLIETQPQVPGKVLVRGTAPARLLAIVHDLNQEPSWKKEWVEKALEGILRAAEGRNFQAIALPLLGSVHGAMDNDRFVSLLGGILKRTPLHHLKRLWLIVPKGKAQAIIASLRAMLGVSRQDEAFPSK
ncbi:MAG: hypothetical protein KKE57_06820 [Proteobacteria bacterium]|nr:hypothetical protein [Pseudomonadota bacterium]